MSLLSAASHVATLGASLSHISRCAGDESFVDRSIVHQCDVLTAGSPRVSTGLERRRTNDRI